MMKSFARASASLAAGVLIAACSRNEPVYVEPVRPVRTYSGVAAAEKDSCDTAYSNTLYNGETWHMSPEELAPRKAISNTPQEGRMLLDGCSAHWKREAHFLATQKADRFTCDDLRWIAVRLYQIKQSGVPADEVNGLRTEVIGIFDSKCANVRLMDI